MADPEAHVLELIEQMTEADRPVLEPRLAAWSEAAWERSVAENRRYGQERGVTQETVDQALHRRRYGE